MEIGNKFSTSASVSPSASLSPSASISQSVSQSISPSSSVSPSIQISPSSSQSPSASNSPSGSLSPSASISPSHSVSPSPSPTAGLHSVFNDLIHFFVKCSDGNVYGFGNTGKIYKIQPDLACFQVYDLRKPIIGASEKPSSGGNIYLEFADATNLHRKLISKADGTLGDPSWNDVNAAGTVQGDIWPKNNLDKTKWHPMAQVGGDVVIGNKDKLAMSAYDDSYTNEALDIIPGRVIRAVLERVGRAVMGSTPAIEEEAGINAMIDCEYPFAQVGNQGDIYYSDFVNSIAVKRLICGGKVNPGGVANVLSNINVFDWEQTALSWIDKQTIGNMALFAFWDGVVGKQGIYTAGRNNKNQPFVWNCEYQFDADEIGAVTYAFGLTIFSYQIGSTYGVKVTDTQNKAVGIYEGLDFYAPIKTPLYITTADWAELFFAPLPANTSVEFWYRINKKGVFKQAQLASIGTTSTYAGSGVNTGSQRAVFRIGEKFDIIEPRVVVNPSGNITPEVYRIRLGFK